MLDRVVSRLREAAICIHDKPRLLDSLDSKKTKELGGAIAECERLLHQKFSEMEALVRVTKNINTGVVLDETLDIIYENFRPVIPYDRIGLALVEEGAFKHGDWICPHHRDMPAQKRRRKRTCLF